jgi:chromosome segregation ATPase
LKSEIQRLKEELSNKDKIINKITNEFGTKESEFSNQVEELQKKIKDDNKNYLDLLNKHEILEKEFSELVRNILILKTIFNFPLSPRLKNAIRNI